MEDTEVIHRKVKGGTKINCYSKENQSEISETRRPKDLVKKHSSRTQEGDPHRTLCNIDHTSKDGCTQTKHDRFWLKASIAHACFAVCSLCLMFECLLHLCQPTHLMGRKGWSQMEVPLEWLQVIRGPRPTSQQWPSAKMNVPDGAAGSSRALETAQGWHRESTGPQTQVESRCSPRDRPILSYQARESFGGDGRRARPCRGGTQDRIDESQGCIEATCCGGGNRPVSKVHRQVREADQRVWTHSVPRSALSRRRPRNVSRGCWKRSPEPPPRCSFRILRHR